MRQAVFQFEIDGEEHEAPFDINMDDLGPAEAAHAVRLRSTDDPVEVVCAFLFVKAQRHVPLEDSAFPQFFEQLAPMFDGDGSMIRLRSPDGG